jgi:RNA polymerase sigma factor (sigma-70 family)
MKLQPPYESDNLATRSSLLGRLRNLQDDLSWQEFFDTYWKLIYSAATKAGLPDGDAQDVVQEAILTVSRRIKDFRYDPSVGSFKGWLLHTTRWRILDQLRKRKLPQNDYQSVEELEQSEDLAGARIDVVWEVEWQQTLVDAAIQRIKPRVAPKHFQAFELFVLKRWPASQVAGSLSMTVAYVHLLKHRFLSLVQKEVKRLEKEGV